MFSPYVVLLESIILYWHWARTTEQHNTMFEKQCYKCIWRAIPKGAKSTFVTLRKTRFFVRVRTRLYGKLNIEFTISSFCSVYSDQKCVLKIGGKLNNAVILVTRFWSKIDLAPFGIKLFIIYTEHGGGGVTHHMTGYAPVSPQKFRKSVFFL